MTVPPRLDSFEVSDYLGVLRRRGWIALGLACLGTLGAAAYLTVAPKTYTATAVVNVTVNAANGNQLQGGRTSGAVVNMDNEAQIVQSYTVEALAVKALHSDRTPGQLGKQVSVTVPANTTVLQISCQASSPRGAAECAQAFATSYLSSREATARSKISSELSVLQARAKPLQVKSLKVHNQIKSLSKTSSKLGPAEAQYRDLNSQLAVLRSDIASLGASVNYIAGYVITPATAPITPSSPKALLYLPSGLIAGLVLGLILAFTLDRRDDRIHAARDLQRILDLPVLLSYPQKRLGPQAAIVSPRSRTGRAYTELAQAVASNLGDGNHVVLVAGASAGRSGSVVAANLAATLARTRSEVILVCADLRDSVTPQLLGVGDGRGLAEILTGQAAVSEVARRPADSTRLRVITPGVDTTSAFNHLQHDTNRQLVAELQRDVRYVVIEVQATGDGADTFSLAEFADVALVVVELESTRLSEAADTTERLDRMRTVVLGAAVLPPSKRRSRKSKRSSAARPEQRANPANRRQRPLPGGQPRVSTAESRPRALSDQPARESKAATARSAGETWPLPRVQVSATPEEKGSRPSTEDAGGTASKLAGGS